MCSIYNTVINKVESILLNEREEIQKIIIFTKSKKSDIICSNIRDTYNLVIIKNSNILYNENVNSKNLIVKIKNTNKNNDNLLIFKDCNKKYLITNVIFDSLVKDESKTGRTSNKKRKRSFTNGESIVKDESKTGRTDRTSNKKRKRSFTNGTNDDKLFVSATKTRNYILDDGILDFLDYYSKYPKEHMLSFNELCGLDDGYTTRSKNTETNIKKHKDVPLSDYDMLKEEGIKYEEKIMKEIKEKVEIHKPKIKLLNNTQVFDNKPFNYEYLTNNHAEIIYQPLLINKTDNTFGCPDLIIRSDIFNKFFNYEYLTKELFDRFKKETTNQKYFYVVVDIKHSNLEFNSDKETLRNTDTIKPYKSQLCVYNNALSEIQHFDPKISFIIGKNKPNDPKALLFSNSPKVNDPKALLFSNSPKVNDPFDKYKLGIIDYDIRDSEYINKTKNAIEWIRRVKTEGKSWVLNPKPSVKELYPRMNNEKDDGWRNVKQKLAESIGEITSVYYCGIKERRNSHDNNILSWRDERCNSKILGFNQESKSTIPNTIDNILNINRNGSSDAILPEIINTKIVDNFNWRNINETSLEFYLDYETIVNETTSEVVIFQMGVGHMVNNKWIYKSFVLKNTVSIESEKDMFDNFFEYIINVKESKDSFVKDELVIRNFLSNDCHFIHWYPHEKLCYNKIKNKLNLPDLKFMDLSKLFREEPIVVKGSLKYKLKSISKAMYESKLITTSWDTSNECSSGLTAMLIASKLYKNNMNITNDNKIMKDIVKYNEIDCKVLWDILRYLRENH
jgi:predicted RecB family nuclease